MKHILNANSICLLITLVLLGVGCEDGSSSPQQSTQTQRYWLQVDLAEVLLAGDAMVGIVTQSIEKAIEPIRQQRLSEYKEMVAAGFSTVGFHPEYKFSIDDVSFFGSVGDNGPMVVVASVTEIGVTHAYQQNLLYVAIISGETVTPIAMLVGSDGALLSQGLDLWKSSITGNLRLFLVSAGPTFQGSASLGLDGWEIEQTSGIVTRLFTLSGPETLLYNDPMSLNVVFEKAMTVDVRLGAAIDRDYQQAHRASFIEVGYAADSVETALVGAYAAKIVIPKAIDR